MRKDFYLVLRVTQQATPEQIRSAYRQRALELHPDKSGQGSEPFLELQEAYAVLSDPDRRAAYDREALSPRVWKRGAAASNRPMAESFREVSLSRSFRRFEPSFEEIFDRLSGNFGGPSRPKGERRESLTVDIPLSPQEAIAGGSAQVLVPVRIACPRCQGRGRLGPFECERCQGHGGLATEYPVRVRYPRGLRQDCIVQVPLDALGIRNFYLAVRFRPVVRI